MKKSRLLRNKRKTKKRGGAIIGSGQQGIAFSPPLKCKNPENTPELNSGRASPFTKRRKRYITKITTANVAKTEMDAAVNLIRFDPMSKFTAPALGICRASNIQENVNYASRNNIQSRIQSKGLNTLIFQRHRGKSIMDIFEEGDITFDDARDILVALCVLLLRVSKELNGKAALIHKDAHPGNIVYDDVTLECTLIDFGFAIKNDPVIAEKLAHDDTNVPVTEDIIKIYEYSILGFFSNTSPEIRAKLLGADARMPSWYASTKELMKKYRRNEASQGEFLDSTRALMKILQDSQLIERAEEIRSRSASPIGRPSSPVSSNSN